MLIGVDKQILKDKQVIGAGRRRGGCFKCGSTDRERLVYIYLKEILHLFEPGKNLNILHIAPEKHLSEKISESQMHQYVCGDSFAEGYKYPSYVKQLNVLDLPFPDQYFDLVICNHVLEHIPDDISAMKELFRVLKKGGQAILQVPISKNSSATFEDLTLTDPVQRESTFGQFDHIRIYGQDYLQRLETSGFKVQRSNISEQFARFGLNKEEDIFTGSK